MAAKPKPRERHPNKNLQSEEDYRASLDNVARDHWDNHVAMARDIMTEAQETTKQAKARYDEAKSRLEALYHNAGVKMPS